MTYDVIVVGLGAMGSAATYQLAKSGAKVLGLDRYEPPHIYGSSHGDSRITRLAIGEGSEYVPLVQRSHHIWRDIERQTGADLLTQCGGLIMGVQGGHDQHGVNDFLNHTLSAADLYGIQHEKLNTQQIADRFKQFHLSGTEDGYYEPEAGFVRPEKCIEAQLELAKRHDAAVHFNEHVTAYEDNGSHITISTDSSTYTARKLIITAGPWIRELLPEFSDHFKIYRQVLYWFDLKDPSLYDLYRNMPVYIWEFGDSPDNFMYGFPMIDGPEGGAKLATEDYTTTTSPENMQRAVTQDEIDAMYERYVKGYLPGLSNKCVRARACLYTVTPDHRFVIDFHPMHSNVIVASPCSGHGFKHSAAIGEALSELASNGKSTLDLSSFALSRFAHKR